MSSVNDAQVKQQVRQFYDQIGWKTVGEGVYQNAQYEDLRPVSREYIHPCGSDAIWLSEGVFSSMLVRDRSSIQNISNIRAATRYASARTSRL
jgi:hypothetical protein